MINYISPAHRSAGLCFSLIFDFSGKVCFPKLKISWNAIGVSSGVSVIIGIHFEFYVWVL